MKTPIGVMDRFAGSSICHRAYRRVQKHQAFRRALVESLEDRRLLTADFRSLAEVAALISPYKSQLEGVTIVTHGFQPDEGDGDNLISLGSAIRKQADVFNGDQKSAWFLDYDVSEEGGQGAFDFDLQMDSSDISNGSFVSGSPSEIVLLFDWAAESNEISTGWAEGAGDALFNMLTGLSLVDVQSSSANPQLHFIAHSFGAAVTSEAVERLAFYDVPVDQVTYLDPHDFDQGLVVDAAQEMNKLGKPDGYGVVAWDNVAFTDTYYQTRGLNGSLAPDAVVPKGRPIPGSYNVFLSDNVELPDSSSDPYAASDLSGDHSFVWDTLYLGSVSGSHPSGKPESEVVGSFDYQSSGYAYSRIAQGISKRPSNQKNFYDQDQDHQFTPTAFKPSSVPVSARIGIAAKTQSPGWDSDDALFNGNFQHPGDEYDALSPLAGDNLIPGWSHHGGGGAGRVETQAANYFLELTSNGPSRTHNYFYLHPQAAVLTFELAKTSSSLVDDLEVLIGDEVIAKLPTNSLSSTFGSYSLAIPSELRGRDQTLTFRLATAQGAAIQSTVRIDNISLGAGGRTGDIIPIDLSALAPTQSQFGIIGWDLATASGGASVALDVERDALRGDYYLKVDGNTVAYSIFSDRVSSEAFASSGKLFLAPPTTPLGQTFDRSEADYGFQGDLGLWYRTGPDLAVIVNTSGVASYLNGTATDKAQYVQGRLIDAQNGQFVPTIPQTAIVTPRPISLGGTSLLQQWLIHDAATNKSWVLVENEESYSLFEANQLSLTVVAGFGNINDAEKVPSNSATVLEIAQLQQRLRYWNYPDEDGNLLVVDGIVGPHTRHAVGLFQASVNGSRFSEANAVFGNSFNYINALNSPRWTSLVKSELDHFDTPLGPYLPNLPARHAGTNWVVDTVRATANALKTGSNQIQLPITVGALSAPNGPGPNLFHHAGHDAGMSVDFAIPSDGPSAISSMGNGSLSQSEAEAARLVNALEVNSPAGVTLKSVILSNSDIANAINQGRITPVAIVDPSFEGGIHVEFNPPEVSFFPPLPDPVISDEVNNGLQDVIEWLDKLISTELDKQLPALVEEGSGGSDPQPATIEDALGVSNVLTGDGSILDEIKSWVGLGPSPSVLAEHLSKTQVDLYLNLLKQSSPPSVVPFSPANPATYNYSSVVTVFDAIGQSHNATIYFVKTSTANQWQARVAVDGALQAGSPTLEFSSSTDQLVNPASKSFTIAGYSPNSGTPGVDLVFDLSQATQRNDQYKSGWTTWSVAVQGQYEKSTGKSALHFTLNGRASTGDKQFDFAQALANIGVSLSGDIQAVANVTGRLDFTVTWDANAPGTVSESIALKLNDFSANVDILVDTILVDAKAGLLQGSIIDSGTLASPGPTNSFIAASAGFDAELNQGQPVLVGQLDTLEVGDDYAVNVTCDLNGVLYFTSTLGGVPIPGTLKMLVGLGGAGPTITPDGDLDDILDQLKNLTPKSLADTVAQLADWLSGMSNFGAFKDKLPLGGGSFGKAADLGEELKKLLFNKFQEVQLLAESAPAGVTTFADATTFQIAVSDNLTKTVSIPASVTANNTSVADLAEDLSAALASALQGTDFAGALVAVAIEGKLAIRSRLPGVTGIRVANADGQTTPGVERLGFGNNQSVDQLRFETLQDLERMIREALNLADGQFSLVYNRALGTITGSIDFLSESLLGSSAISLGSGFGGLADIQSSSTIDLWRRAQGGFDFGIDLSPVGVQFAGTFSDATRLDALPTWSMGINGSHPADLKITLSDGSVFDVDLGAAVTIGDVRTAIAQASDSGSGARVSVVRNAANNGLKITDLTHGTDANYTTRFKVEAAGGVINGVQWRSFAALILGLAAEDDNDDGVIEGRALHGESLANRFYVKDFEVDLLVQATAADIDATANFGIVKVGIQNGSGEASAKLSLSMNDPNSDGRIYLSEMVQAGVLQIIGTPSLECDLNLELPVVLTTSVPGLTLPNNAAVIVSWAAIHEGTEPTIHLRGLDNLKGFENFSPFGLSLDLPVARALGDGLDLKTALPEIGVRLRGATSVINLDLSFIDPSLSGTALKPVETFRDLMDAIRIQTEGRLTLNFSADGRALELFDNTTGPGPFQLSSLNASNILNQLGLAGISAVAGKISGAEIYQPSILDALRRVVALLRTFEELDGLNAPLPGTTVSINDLLDFADKLDQTLNELQNRPAAALQDLEQALEAGLGLDGSKLALKLDGRALKIAVRLTSSASRDLPLNFDLADGAQNLGKFASVKSSGRVNAAVGADFVLSLGMDLSDPDDLRPFLYTVTPQNANAVDLIDMGTRLDITAKLSTPSPINMSAAIGPLGAHIVNGYVKLDVDGDGPLTAPAKFSALLKNTASDGRRYLDQLSLNSLQTTIVGELDAALPVYMPTTAAGDFIGNIGLTANLQDPVGSFDVALPDFSQALSNVNLGSDLSVFLDGWDGVMGLFEEKLIDKLDDLKLPVIGNQLGDLARFIVDLRDEVAGIDPAALVGNAAANTLQNQLFQKLSGINVLREKDGQSGISANDVLVTQTATSVEFEVSLGGSFAANDLNLDLNLPGLGLKVANALPLSLVANWRLDVGVGIDVNGGVYLKLAPNKADDLHVDFIASLSGGPINAKLGFLDLTVANNRTEAAAEFDIDLNPGADGRLSLGEIFSAPLTTSFSGNVLEGGVDHNKAAIVDWTLTASVGGVKGLPQLRTGFDLNWTVNSFADLTTAPQIEFGGVQLNLGSFLADFLGPIVKNVNDALEPVRPIIDVLTAPLPVISDLAGPVTLLDLADFFGYGDYNDFIQAVDDIGDLAQQLSSSIGAEKWINLGSFSVDGGLALLSRGKGNLAPRKNPLDSVDYQSIKNQIDTSGGQQASAFRSSTSATGGGFRFPILENPSLAFGLLLGQDVTLFGYDMPALTAQFEYSQYFPIWGPIGARITGSVGATADFAFGFDTYGARQFVAGGYSDPGKIFDGFFISDTANVDGTGADVPEITLSGALKVAAEVNVAVARIGAGGGIYLDVDFNLHDNNNDGKVRFEELDDNFKLGPIHVFDVSGQLSAKLFAYYEIGFRAFGKWVKIAGDEFELAEVVLLDFSLPRPSEDATQFSYVDGGVLKFHTTEGNDQFTVSRGTGADADKVVVTSPRLRDPEMHPLGGLTRIEFDGLGGDDRFTVLEGLAVPVTVYGRSGGDQITTGDGYATVYGDSAAEAGSDGRDIIVLGAGGGTVYGGGGDDEITGSPVADTIHGGSGRDLIKGLDGGDFVYGEAGADRIEGGLGNDDIYGGDGADVIDAGRGLDYVEGQDGDDNILGGFDDDILVGGPGNDQLNGDLGDDLLIGDSAAVNRSGSFPYSVSNFTGAGADTLLGDRGTDYVYAGGGNDRVDAGPGSDFAWGQEGNDTLDMAAGVDYADGGSGDDRILGGAGNDLLVGNAGRDVLLAGSNEQGGGSTSDTNTIYGDSEDSSDGTADESRADTIFGDVGADTIYAASGSDTVYALGGNNVVRLGFGNNRLTAGDGSDDVYAQSGNDDIRVGNGNNSVHAGDGENVVITGSGIDQIYTGSGNDSINAGAAGTTANPQIINAGAGSNRIVSGNGVETITTLGGQDTISSGDGAKTIDAGDGLNVITTGNVGSGTTEITVGSGADQIRSGTGTKIVHGGSGRNEITLGDGNATVDTLDDEDHITIGSGVKVVKAGGGDNIIQLGNGPSTVTTGNGNDDITTGDGQDIIITSGGNNVIRAGGGRDFIQTAGGEDQIFAEDGDDLVLAMAGNDRVSGGAGNDLIVGDQGDDNLSGDKGQDVIWGGLPDAALAAWGMGNFTVSAPPDWPAIEAAFSWHGATFTISNQASFSKPLGYQAAVDQAVAQGRSAYSLPLLVVPFSLVNFSVVGVNASAVNANDGDGFDTIAGGDDTDWLFGGGDADFIDGGTATDYIDGGAANDRLLGGIGETIGEGGDDVIRGGLNNDVLRGGDGLDLLFGDEGDDLVFADAGAGDGSQSGQILWGGPGKDTLYAYAGYDAPIEATKIGDHLIGGSGEDLLYGNLRKDLLDGEQDADFLHGDYVDGPLYARNVRAATTGGDDILLGGFGQDQLFGGGGNDILRGNEDGDWLEGLDGNDALIGGPGIDILTLDVSNTYSVTGGDKLFGHEVTGSTLATFADNALTDTSADIVLLQGDAQVDPLGNPLFDDDIFLSDSTGVSQRTINVTYRSASARDPITGQLVNWVGNPNLIQVQMNPSVEQIQVAGLMGDDVISVQGLDNTQETVRSEAVSYAAMVGGGPGNDILLGSPGNDRLDGGPGSDRIYGLAGDDRLWGDYFNGNASFDADELYAGPGYDDLIGGAGDNVLSAWSFNPTLNYTFTGNYSSAQLRDALVRRDVAPKGNLSSQFGVFRNSFGKPVANPAAGQREDTGLNRMLGNGSPNSEQLYGGTGLDFLYGNGGGGAAGDQLYTYRGEKFGAGLMPWEQDDAWKAYAKQTDAVWYVGAGTGLSNAADTVRIDYVTDPTSPVYDRHQITISQSGTFNVAYQWSGASPFAPVSNQGGIEGAEALNPGEQETYFDIENVGYHWDAATGRLFRQTPEERRDHGLGTVGQTDLAATVLPPEGDFLAILVDTLGGNDTVVVGETVQKSVWVDAGAGDDLVRMEPRLAFLPDKTDRVSSRNDTPKGAFDVGVLSTDADLDGLTIDSAIDVNGHEQSEVDWFSFSLNSPQQVGDVLRILPDGVGSSKVDKQGELVTVRDAQNLRIELFSGIAPAWSGTASYTGTNNLTFSVTVPNNRNGSNLTFTTADGHTLVNGRTYNLRYAADRSAQDSADQITPAEVSLMNSSGSGPIELAPIATSTSNLDLSSLLPGVRYYARVFDLDGVTGQYSLSYRSVTTPDVYESSSSPNTTPANAHRIEAPSSIERIENLTLPTVAQATTGGDWFVLPLEGTTGTISVRSDVSARTVKLTLLDADTLTVVPGADNVASIDLSTLPGLTGEYFLKVTADGPVRYDLLLNVAQALSGQGTMASPFGISDLDRFSSVLQLISPATEPSGPLADAAAKFYEFTLAQTAELGDALGLRSLSPVTRLVATNTVSGGQLVYTDVTNFQLVINGNRLFNVSLAAAATSDNTNLAHLASDLSAAINAALAGSDLAGTVTATLSGTRLSLISNDSRVASLRVSQAAGQVEAGLSRLGFVLNQSAQQVVTASPENRLRLQLLDATGKVLQEVESTDSDPQAILDLAGITAGTYRVRVDSAWRWDAGTGNFKALSKPNASYEFYSATGLRTSADRAVVSGRKFASTNYQAPQSVRRDVILGGADKDYLLGGSGEDWIFGGSGNDYLSGGYDRQVEDLIVGGDGDDYFILLPDDLPTENGVPKDLGSSDLFVGGAGTDQVYYVGGNLNASVKIRDFVTIGFDRFLGRHKVSSLVWDTTNPTQQFFAANNGKYLQQFAYFRAQEIERTVIDGGDGRDTIHIDPGFLLGGESWGISGGDLAAGATAFQQLVLLGGLDTDLILGGAGSETIVGGRFDVEDNQGNFLAGGLGDDLLLGGGHTESDWLYGGRLPVEDATLRSELDQQFVLLGTPDQGMAPTDTPLVVSYYSPADDVFNATPGTRAGVPFLPVKGTVGISLPSSTSVSQGVADAFAFEGMTSNDALGSIASIGDFNGDGLEDFIVSGAAGESYLLLGPVYSSTLSRVESTPPEQGGPSITIRSQLWDISPEFGSQDAFTSAAPSVRAPGRADQVLDASLGRFVASGNLIDDPKADLVFAKIEAGNFVLRIVSGVNSGERRLNAAQKTITIPTAGLSASLDDLSIAILDWNGDGKDELVVVGKPNAPLATATVDQARTAGYVFNGATLIGATTAFTQANAAFTIQTDVTSRAATLSIGGWTPERTASNLSAVAVGDVNRDGYEDLMFGDSRFAVYTDASQLPGTKADESFGRTYLVLGRGQMPTGSQALLGGNPAAYSGLAQYVWQGRGLGASVFATGDTNHDGAADFGFTRDFEAAGPANTAAGDANNYTGSTFIIGGTLNYQPNFDRLNSSGFFNPLQPADAQQRNRVLGAITTPVAGAAELAPQSVATGDFDGDGRSDLVLSFKNQNESRVFYSFAADPLQTVQTLRSFNLHNGKFVGEVAGDGFGTLSRTPYLDLDSDGISDLIIGAPQADIDTAELLGNSDADAGRVYVVYGSGRPGVLPANRVETTLANREIPRAGLYLVERPDGQPFKYYGTEDTTLSASQNERWYSFTFQGDGQIGDVIKLRTVSETNQPISRPTPSRFFSSNQSDAYATLDAGEKLLDPLKNVLPLTVAESNPAETSLRTSPDASGNWFVGDDVDTRTLLLDLDLSKLFDLVESPEELINSAVLSLGFSHATFNLTGWVQVDVLDEESFGGLTLADVTSASDRFRPAAGALNRITSDSFGGAFPSIGGELSFNLKQEIVDAVAAGKSRLKLRLTSNVTTPLRVDAKSVQFDLQTNRRLGVVADLYDAQGRRIAGGFAASSIIDLRSVPAGNYHLRVYDPFAEAPTSTSEGHRLYDPAYNVATNRGALSIAVEIEAPKVGDADPRTDRDELRGGGGPDRLNGGAYYDRLFGGLDSDQFVAENLEIRDRDYGFDDQTHLPYPSGTETVTQVSVVAPGELGYLVATPDDFDVTIADSALQLAVAQELGLAVSDVGGGMRLSRPLRATDLTSLVQLYADPAALGRFTPRLTIDSVSAGQFTDASLIGSTEITVGTMLTIYPVNQAPGIPMRVTNFNSATGIVSYSLDGVNYTLTVQDTYQLTRHVITSLSGLEYAVNLEYLGVANQRVSSLSAVEPGIRLEREEQGELGLRSLRFIDLDGNPLQADKNEAYPKLDIGPLHVLGRLSRLEYISIDSLSGAVIESLNDTDTNDQNTYYDLSFADQLDQLRWLSARNNQITTYQDVFLASSYTSGHAPFGWYPLDEISGEYANNHKVQGAPSAVIFGGVSQSTGASPAPGVENSNAGSYQFDGIDGHVAIPLRVGNDLWKNTSDSFSVSFWFKTSDQNSGLFALTSEAAAPAAGSQALRVYLQNGQVHAKFNTETSINTTGSPLTASTNFSDNDWHHVLLSVTRTSGTAGGHRLYVDGILVGTNPSVSGLPTNLQFAQLGWSAGGFLRGQMDEVRIYRGPVSNPNLPDDQINILASGNERSSQRWKTHQSGVATLADKRFLQVIDLSHNQIADITPFATTSYVYANNGAVIGSNPLRWLDLPDNSVASIDALAGQWIINNGDDGYSEIGTAWTGANGSNAFKSDYRIVPSSYGEAAATYRFTDLPVVDAYGQPIQYEVSVTWPADVSRTSAAEWQIQGKLNSFSLPISSLSTVKHVSRTERCQTACIDGRSLTLPSLSKAVFKAPESLSMVSQALAGRS